MRSFRIKAFEDEGADINGRTLLFVVSLEVAVVQAVGFFGLVAPLLGCDSFFVVRYGLSSFGKCWGWGFLCHFLGLIWCYIWYCPGVLY